jgi:hypothetical protein
MKSKCWTEREKHPSQGKGALIRVRVLDGLERRLGGMYLS